MKKARAFAVTVIILLCVGLGVFLVLPSSLKPHITPAPSPPTPVVTAPIQSPTKVKIYRIAFNGDEAKLKAVEAEVPADKNPAEAALRRLIQKGDEGDLVNPIPRGTRLLSLKVRHGLATVDLSREFSDNFSGGAEDEALCIGSILRTLSQFPEIKRVLFELEGKPLDTLGHLELSGPQDVNWVGTGVGGN